MAYSQELYERIYHYLEKEELNYSFDEEQELFRLHFTMKNKLKGCTIVLDLREDRYLSYALIDISADEECRDEVAKYLTMANYGLVFGNFELDYSDGEVRYKFSVDCDHCLPSEQVIEDSIYIPVGMMRRYGDGLLSVIFGFSDAASAVKKAEAKQE